MIYCVLYEDARRYLEGSGFRSFGAAEGAEVFVRNGDRFSIRQPSVDGHIPEILVNDAFDAARLEPPPWNVFWFD